MLKNVLKRRWLFVSLLALGWGTAVLCATKEEIDAHNKQFNSINALIKAIGEGKEFNKIEKIVKKTKDLNWPDKQSKWSPLTRATDKNNIEVIRLLLERGANPNYCPVSTKAPLFIAAEKNDLELVKLLLKHGADKNKKWHTSRRDQVGKFAWQLASKKEVIDLLKPDNK